MPVEIPFAPESKDWQTRFAPSPTGYLHLGHVVSAAWVWAFARRFGASVLLRIEDHDLIRSKKIYEDEIFEDLRWLGFFDLSDVKVIGVDSPVRQSDRIARYREVVEQLETGGCHFYGCKCSRKQIMDLAQSKTATELFYPGTCRQKPWTFDHAEGIRIEIGDEQIVFDDLLHGRSVQQPCAQCGDFLIRDRDHNFTYQFAVCVDDFDQCINLVVRGDDLFDSTGRQLLLADKLGRSELPLFAHHPLVMDPLGGKLSKRQFSERVGKNRLAGEGPEGPIRMAAKSLSIENYNEIDNVNSLINAMMKVP